MYHYTVGALAFVAIWVALFVRLPDSRKPLLWAGLAWGHLGPLSQYWHTQDYWSPTYLVVFQIGSWRFGVEDYLFAFAFAGICAALFDLLLRRKGAPPLTEFRVARFIAVVLLGLVILATMALLVESVGLNSLHAIMVPLVIGAVIILALRPSWIGAALIAASAIAGVMWLFYWGFFFRLFPELLNAWWRTEALSGLRLAGVPVEEVAWAWTAALFVGPALRYCMAKP